MFFIHRNHLLKQELIKAMSALSDAIATVSAATVANATASNAIAQRLVDLTAALATDKDAPAAVVALATAMDASTKVMTDALAANPAP